MRSASRDQILRLAVVRHMDKSQFRRMFLRQT
jgi:hypothetical protein